MNMPLQGGDLRNFEFLFRKFNLKAIEHLNVAKRRNSDAFFNEEDGPVADM